MPSYTHTTSSYGYYHLTDTSYGYLDAEVELSRAAQRLEMEDWSELAQQMSMLRAKLESNKVNSGDSDSSTCEGALDMALPQLSTCDLAYLSPCSWQLS